MADHLILALETSSSICGAAIIKGRECLAFKEEEIPRKHAESLPFFVKSVIYESGEKIKTINAVAIDGMMSTKDIIATKGRASFLGDRAKGHIDPGARSSQLAIEAICNQFIDN